MIIIVFKENNKIKIMKKYILLILLFLLSFQIVYAVENTYPPITLPDGTTYVINEDSTFVDYVAYGFMMIIAIGAVLLLLTLIWAGVNFVMAGGDPGKISMAKELVMNGFVGILILLSSYWIIKEINPGIIDTVNPDIDACSMGGIVLTIDDGGVTKKKCIAETTKKLDIEGNIIDTEWKYEDGDLKEAWAFSGEDYTGGATKLFQDIGSHVPASISTAASVPSGTKSIYLLRRLKGFYFYDDTDYNFKKYPPFFVPESIKNISEQYPNLDNKACSFNTVASFIKTVEGITYYDEPKAIIFEDANYSGKCSLVYSSKSTSLNTPSELPDSKYSSYIGNNKMSSIIVYNVNTETATDPDKGRIILYNSLGCNKGESEQHSICEINISDYSSLILNMRNKTANFGDFPCADWDKDSYIQSIEIPDGKGAVVVMGTNGTCAYFDSGSISQGSNCVGDLRGTGVYEGGSVLGIRPEKVIVIPTN